MGVAQTICHASWPTSSLLLYAFRTFDSSIVLDSCLRDVFVPPGQLRVVLANKIIARFHTQKKQSQAN